MMVDFWCCFFKESIKATMAELSHQSKTAPTAVTPVLPISTKSLPRVKFKPIDLEIATVRHKSSTLNDVNSESSRLFQRLKMFLFGTCDKQFTSDWLRQSFSFSDIPGLGYNIIQHNVRTCTCISFNEYLITS